MSRLRCFFFFTILIALLILSSCEEEPAIMKMDTSTVEPNEEPELVEEVHEEDVDEFIEFPRENEIIRLNLNLVPILKQFLQASPNPEKTVESMVLQEISKTNEDNSIYLIEFSCHEQLCSYLLIDQSKDNSGYLVADLAKLVEAKMSPDNEKILLHFIRELSNSPYSVGNVAVVDLEKWEPKHIENQEDNRIITDYNWPITSAEWLDNETITVTVPDVLHSDAELFTDWINSENSTTINIQLNIN